MTVPYLNRDRPTKVSLRGTKQQKEKRKRELKKQEKIERLAREYEHLPQDDIERWVDEDFDEMESQLDKSDEFCDDLSEYIDLPIKTTGTTWHSYYRPIGKVLRAIRNNCNENNKTTMLIIRPNDPTIYRLSTDAGQEFTVLSKAIREGYILSKIKIHGGQILG